MSNNKKRKACSLSSVVGAESMYLFVKGDALLSRGFKYLLTEGMTNNTAMPFFFAPSSQLKPLVTRKEKQEILMDTSDKKNVSADAPQTEFLPEIGEEARANRSIKRFVPRATSLLARKRSVLRRSYFLYISSRSPRSCVGKFCTSCGPAQQYFCRPTQT